MSPSRTSSTAADLSTPRDRTHRISPLLGPADLAEYLGLPLGTVYQWRATGKGPRGFRVGKFVRYRLADVEAWEQEQLDKEQEKDAA